MKEFVLIGGVGSSPTQYDYLAETVQHEFGVKTTGISLREASANPERLADFVTGRDVFSHSMGADAVNEAIQRGAEPESWSLIGPPMPEEVKSLIRRGAAIGLHDPAAAEQVEDKLLNFGSIDELLRHPRISIELILRAARFDALEAAGKASERGIPTRIGFMESDGLFDLNKVSQESIDRARRLGVTVYTIAGSHTRFTHDPVNTLKELEVAAEIESELPERELMSFADAAIKLALYRKQRVEASLSSFVVKMTKIAA